MFITFNIDLLNFYVTELSLVIQKEAVLRFTASSFVGFESKSEHSNKNLIRHQLKFYKIISIYFRLWTVNQRINKYFGYSLMAIILHEGVGLVYIGLWAFQQIYSLKDYNLEFWSRLSMRFLTIKYR